MIFHVDRARPEGRGRHLGPRSIILIVRGQTYKNGVDTVVNVNLRTMYRTHSVVLSNASNR